jgi:type VI secretion system protein ImpJ
MGTPVAVHWHEGLFLRPQHLQAMQRYIQDSVIAERRRGCSYSYGVISAHLDEASLENQIVRFERLSAVTPAGIFVSFPENCELPSLNIEEAFSTATEPLTICLAVPLWQSARANAIDFGGREDYRTARIFRVAEINCLDENNGKNEQPIHVRKINARLQFNTDEMTDLDVLPLLKVSPNPTNEGGLSPRRDSDYIPPCLLSSGHPALQESLRDIINLMEVSRRQLYAQLRVLGANISNLTLGIQFERWERLKVLNSYSTKLACLARAPAATPFDYYLELSSLQGELAAFYPGRPEYADCAGYNHDNLGLSFQGLFKQLRNTVAMSGDREPLVAKFIPDGNRLRIAELSQDHLTKPNEYYLVIDTKVEPALLERLVTDRSRFKLMSREESNSTSWGLKLQYEKFLPPELSYKPNRHFFRIYRGADDPPAARMWDKIRTERKVVARWPDMTTTDYELALYMTLPSAE